MFNLKMKRVHVASEYQKLLILVKVDQTIVCHRFVTGYITTDKPVTKPVDIGSYL